MATAKILQLCICLLVPGPIPAPLAASDLLGVVKALSIVEAALQCVGQTFYNSTSALSNTTSLLRDELTKTSNEGSRS